VSENKTLRKLSARERKWQKDRENYVMTSLVISSVAQVWVG
jgi:hypothetical protein